MGSGRRSNDGQHAHYDALFPRQELLDLGMHAADGAAAADESKTAPGSAAAQAYEVSENCIDHPTWSESWRRECEARHVMKMPRADRRQYYQRVREVRGDAAAFELIAEVERQWVLANPI